MFGVEDNVYFCNTDKLEKMNKEIRDRNIPSKPLRPEFSLRPVPTQRTILPVVDNRVQPDVPLKRYENFSVEKVFNPGTSQAPWNGFAANINTDSLLRNQFFALQKCSEAEFIPSSKSSLYVAPLALNSKKEKDYTIVEEGILRECKMPEHKYLFNNSTRFERTLITNN
tara:strand:+ start:7099 stop:7605 length:507 start_codon:yes stop_codon:yes gene_type:complete